MARPLLIQDECIRGVKWSMGNFGRGSASIFGSARESVTPPDLIDHRMPGLFHSDPAESDRLRFDGGAILNAKTS